jgi:hypothetical protein
MESDIRDFFWKVNVVRRPPRIELGLRVPETQFTYPATYEPQEQLTGSLDMHSRSAFSCA